MQRRHFLRLSGATTIGVLFSRLTYAAGGATPVIGPVDEVWVQSGADWFRLQVMDSTTFGVKDVVVQVKSGSVYVSSPTMEINALRLRWNHHLSPGSVFLGDAFERSYGDLQWKSDPRGVKNPWYVVVHNGNDSACFGVKTGAASICWWELAQDHMELTLDARSGGNGVMLGSRTLHMADIVTMANRPGENAYFTLHRFCGMMCERPRLPKRPIYGINDWYFAYGNNNYDLIRNTTAMMAELVTSTDNRPFSVVDAGWAQYSPLDPGDGGWNEDFSKPNDKFKDMHKLANEIKGLGMRPGLWIRPLCGRHDEKPSLVAPSIPGRDDPKNPVLDPTIPENLARIKAYFDVYHSWGMELVKHDYTTYDIFGRWGINMLKDLTSSGWSFNDRSKTNAEIINTLYKTIRDGAGDGMYIIGCNTMSHLSAGVFEMCRIGDDTSGKEWDRTRKMGVNTLAFRLPQHNKFYAVDGDCVGLTTDISWNRNKQWLQLLAGSSAPLFISAQPEAMGAEQKAAVKQAFAQAAQVQPLAEPLDWMTNFQPSKWKLDGAVVDFDWS
jgi:alpha-galactosidase